MNVSLSNIQSSITQNAIPTNNLSIEDKSTFMNMLTMIMGEKSAIQGALQPGDSIESNDLTNLVDLSNPGMNFNILELLIGNKSNIREISNNTLSKESTSSNDITVDKEKKSKEFSVAEELVEINPFNYNIYNSSISQLQDTKVLESLSSEYLQKLTSYDNFNVSQGRQGFANDEFLKKADIFSPEQGKNSEVKEKEISSINISSEKLITEIEGHRDQLKNKINMQAELLTANRSIHENQDAIIKVSDESSQIKSQILSQVKDKIVFMADEGAGPDNTTKHVTMELHPESLGKVDIKMTFENNKITVEIKALNKETQKLISSNSDELVNILGKSSETVNIVVKSNDSIHEQFYNYNYTDKINEQAYQDDENGQGKHKNNYYYHEDNKDNKDNKDNEDDSIFSQLINLRSIKLNA